MLQFFHGHISKLFAIIVVISLAVGGFLIFQNVATAAITYQTPGAIAYSTAGGTSVSPAYPASIATNDLLILIIGMKPSTANSGSVTTPTGWTADGSLTGAGGYGTTLGGDTGNTNVFAFYKVATGTESGTLAVTLTTNNISWAQMYRFSNASGSWSVAGATGSDTSAGNVSITHSTNPGVTAGDYILGAMIIPTDVGGGAQFSSEALSQTGVTFNTPVEISEPFTNVGNDIGGVTYYSSATAGTASASPTFTATAGGTTTNVRGPGIFIRVREANTAPTLSISQPDGVSDTVTVGASYNITYSLADPDPFHTVTSAFYYDTDAVGLNGIAITGACATAPEGSGATCSWNTTGMTPGTYYVYGLTSDGIAPQVSAYSTGVIIINAVPVVPTVTSPTVTSITTSGATLGANVTSLGIPAVISVRGTCWGTSSSPATNCTAEGGTTTGVFSHARTGMSPNTFYYYRGYATNSTGTGYSGDGTFTTTATASGSVSASPSTCTISSGASTCTVPFTWSITNATSPNLYNASTTNTYSTLASGTGVSYPITNGANTVQVRDSSTVLASTSVTGSCEVGTTWNGTSCSAITYTIFASPGANGTVMPNATTTVAQGGSQIYSITPAPLYEIATLLIDGGGVAATTTYTFVNVTANHTISATFSLLPVTHTITSSAGANGAIVPLGAIVVADGASQAFNINPDFGFYTSALLVDGGPVSTSSPYTFTNVTGNHTISATFALIPPPHGSFTIIANQNANGTVSPSGSTVVTEGASQAYIITPDSGYDVGSIIIDSTPLSGTSTSYTFTNVTTDHTIEATFALAPVVVVTVVPSTGASRPTTITFFGKAFPGGKVSISNKELRSEELTGQEITPDTDGSFRISFVGILQGLQSFGLIAKDREHRVSQTKFFFVDTRSDSFVEKDILVPPTIDITNGQISRGGTATIFGYASPNHSINLYIDGILSKEALVATGGSYRFDVPTGALEFGQHKARTKQINITKKQESDFSTVRTFIVSKLAVVRADLSGDGKVDIKDWSIFLARFASSDNEVRKSIDLSGDGKVDISDFSIFIKTIRKK